MDTTYMRERNYRMVEKLRLENLREQRRSEHQAGSIHGMEAAHKHSLDVMRKEQAIVKKELAQIRKGSYTTGGHLPTGHASTSKMADAAMLDEIGTRKKKVSDPLAPRKKDLKPRSTRHSDPGPGPQISHERGRKPEVVMKTETSTRPKDQRQVTRPKSPLFGKKQLTTVQERAIDAVSQVNANSTTIPPSLQEKSTKPLKKPARAGGLESKNNHWHDAKNSVSKRLVAVTSRESDHDVRDSPRIPKVGLAPLDTTSTNGAAKTKDEKDTRVVKKPTRFTKTNKKGEDLLDTAVFDPELYSSDGTLRTVHTMPNFERSLEEAKKARYVRHPDKQIYEIELTVSDIFEKDKKGVYKK